MKPTARLGHLGKALCHAGQRGPASGIFAADLQRARRAAAAAACGIKRLWPLYWSNSCCSHPRRAESMETRDPSPPARGAGLSCPLQFLFKFRYQAQFDAAGAENELCSVFIGRCTEPPAGSIATRSSPGAGSARRRYRRRWPGRTRGSSRPWFRLEWERIWREHRTAVLALN